MPSGAVSPLTRALVAPRTQPCPGSQVSRGREAARIQPDLGNVVFRRSSPHPGDHIQPIYDLIDVSKRLDTSSSIRAISPTSPSGSRVLLGA